MHQTYVLNQIRFAEEGLLEKVRRRRSAERRSAEEDPLEKVRQRGPVGDALPKKFHRRRSAEESPSEKMATGKGPTEKVRWRRPIGEDDY